MKGLKEIIGHTVYIRFYNCNDNTKMGISIIGAEILDVDMPMIKCKWVNEEKWINTKNISEIEVISTNQVNNP